MINEHYQVANTDYQPSRTNSLRIDALNILKGRRKKWLGYTLIAYKVAVLQYNRLPEEKKLSLSLADYYNLVEQRINRILGSSIRDSRRPKYGNHIIESAYKNYSGHKELCYRYSGVKKSTGLDLMKALAKAYSAKKSNQGKLKI